MGTTYLKRQKEMKRLEKQREKAERRTQKRLANHMQKELATDGTNTAGDEAGVAIGGVTSESLAQN